jgi:hypothetical protein
MKPSLLVFFFVALSSFLPPSVYGQNSPAIPIYGVFATHTIGIYVPAKPKMLHDLVVNASKIWNKAQIWFDGGQPMFSFVPVGRDRANVTVQFQAMLWDYGLTTWTYSKLPPNSVFGGIVVGATVTLNSNMSWVGHFQDARSVFVRTALHELGHVLGFGELIDGPDIMDYDVLNEAMAISTLDLYALRILAESSSQLPPQFISLPHAVPYELINVNTFIPLPGNSQGVDLLLSDHRVNFLSGRRFQLD